MKIGPVLIVGLVFGSAIVTLLDEPHGSASITARLRHGAELAGPIST